MACIQHLACLFIGILSGGVLGLIIGSIFGPIVVPLLFRLFHKNSYDPVLEGEVVGSCAGIVIGGIRALNALCKTKMPASNPSPTRTPASEEMA